MKTTSQTDWERFDKLSDSDIDFSDIPETNEDFWKDAEWYLPPKKDSLVSVLKRYHLENDDIKMLVRSVEKIAH
jgi:hypothetical protein